MPGIPDPLRRIAPGSKNASSAYILTLIALASLAALLQIPQLFLPGLIAMSLLPGYLIISAFFRDRLTRLALAPALSLSLLSLSLVLANNVMGIPINFANVFAFSISIMIASACVWYRFSLPGRNQKVSRKLFLLVLLSLIAIGIPSSLNGSLSGIGVRYGGNYDNDSWMHQAYANRIILEEQVPIHDPFVSNIMETRFYHFGFHTCLASLSLMTGLRIFQVLQIVTLMLPVWFTLSGFVFLRRFYREKTALLIAFLFLFGGGLGGFILAAEASTHLGDVGLSSIVGYMTSNMELMKRPLGIPTYDNLYHNNNAFGTLIIPQAAGAFLALFLFPLLFLLLERGEFDRKTRFLAGTMLAGSLLFHSVFSLMLFGSLALYFLVKLLIPGPRKKTLAGLIDISLVFLALYLPYYIIANALSGSHSPPTGIAPLLQSGLFVPSFLGLFIPFIFGVPFLLWLLNKERSGQTLFLVIFLAITVSMVSMLIPIEPLSFRNYATRLVFIPVMIGFGLLLERVRVIERKPLLAIILLIVCLSNIINSAGYYYAPLTDKDSISYGEWEALEWIRGNVGADEVIMSAEFGVGPFSKVAAFTGRKIFLGGTMAWHFTEEEQEAFKQEINDTYETPDIMAALESLKRNSVDYVYVGSEERERFSPEGLGKFSRFMDIAFSNGEATVFRRRAG